MTAPGVFERGTDGPKVIMVGFDGSDPSMRAGAYAWGLARRQGSHLIVAYAAGSAPLTALVPGGTAAAYEAEQQTAEDLRRQVEHEATRAGNQVPYTFVTERGDPYGVLVKIAERVHADAIVVGASAHAGHRVIGSVAVRLVRAGRWPVTVVP